MSESDQIWNKVFFSPFLFVQYIYKFFFCTRITKLDYLAPMSIYSDISNQLALNETKLPQDKKAAKPKPIAGEIAR